MKESFRLYAPVPGTFRVLSQPMKYNGYELPQGSGIFFNNQVSFHFSIITVANSSNELQGKTSRQEAIYGNLALPINIAMAILT